MMKKTLFIAVILICLFSACHKTESKVNILVTRIDEYGSCANADAKLLFHVKAFSDGDIVKKIIISSNDVERGTIVLLDSMINSSKAEFDFMYRTLSYYIKDTTSVKLTFTAYSSTDESAKMVYNFNVKGSDDVPLTSHDGIVMYSANSDKPDGFNFHSIQTLYCETADSTTIDIYDVANVANPLELSREWRSNTGFSFTKYNDFDYVNATRQSLENAYLAGARYSSVKEIGYGDVILFGRGNMPLGVIQIVAVYDEEESTNDRYIFNLKK